MSRYKSAGYADVCRFSHSVEFDGSRKSNINPIKYGALENLNRMRFDAGNYGVFATIGMVRF